MAQRHSVIEATVPIILMWLIFLVEKYTRIWCVAVKCAVAK